MTATAQLFNQRAAYFTASGYTGKALYDALAADAELPFSFSLDDIAAIENVKKETLRQRRKRGAGPPFIKIGHIIKAPRDSYCQYLRDRFINPKGSSRR